MTVPFLVESPRWVADHVSMDACRAVIARLRGRPIDHEEVETLAAEIQRALEEEGKMKDGKCAIFRHGGQQNFRRMVLGVGGLFMQQMSGIK